MTNAHLVRIQSINAVTSLQLPLIEGRTGTFTGTLVPTLEFMWSVLIFVRFGSIIADCGLLGAAGLCLLCAIIMTITGFSISSIASNGIWRGGVYHVLINSFGAAIGSSIAVNYYFGLVVLAAVEVVASVEALCQWMCLRGFMKPSYWRQVGMSLLLLMLIFVLMLTGRRVIKNVSVVILVVIVVSIMSLMVGLSLAGRLRPELPVEYPNAQTLQANIMPSPNFNFAKSISLLLPCWLGLFSGVNNYNKLRNPFYSIPRGILWALGISGVLYLTEFALIALTIDRKLLQYSDALILLGYPWQELCLPGVLIVGFGAALQCVLLASAVLHSLMVGLMGNSNKLSVFGRLRRFNLNGEPIDAVALTILLSCPLVFISNLDQIAKIATLCFMLCYGCTNLACCLFSAFKSAQWRPKFTYQSWQMAAVGCVLCFVMMFQVSWPLALLFCFGIAYLATVIQGWQTGNSWGNGINGFLYKITLDNLIEAERVSYYRQLDHYYRMRHNTMSVGIIDRQNAPPLVTSAEDGFWRPQIVAFLDSGNDQRNVEATALSEMKLLQFMSQLKTSSGLCVVIKIYSSDAHKDCMRIALEEHQARRDLNQFPTLEHLPIPQRRKLSDKMMAQQRLHLKRCLMEANLKAFAKVVMAPTVAQGQRICLQTLGLGELTPNTILSVWPAKDSQEQQATSMLELQTLWDTTRRMGLSLLLVKCLHNFPSNDEQMFGNIDIFWTVEEGQLLFLTAYILKQNPVWRNCKLRLFTVCHLSDDLLKLEAELRAYLLILRISVDEITVLPIELLSVSDEMAMSDESNFNRLRNRLVQQKMQLELQGEMNVDLQMVPDCDQVKFQYDRAQSPSLDQSRNSRTSSNATSTQFFKSAVINQLHQAILQHSSQSSLVLINLPSPDQEIADDFAPHNHPQHSQEASVYMDLADKFTSELKRVLIVYSGRPTTSLMSDDNYDPTSSSQIAHQQPPAI